MEKRSQRNTPIL